MRNFIKVLIIFCIIIPVRLMAKEIKYKVADIPKELKENARSVIRNEEIVFELSSISSAVQKVTYAITILNKNGIDDAYFTQYYDKFTHISDIRARVYDENGEQIKRIPADAIIDHSAISGFSIYEDNRVKFIDPKVRTIPFTVEYSYEISYHGLMSYPIWNPTNYSIAIEKSSFKVLVPKDKAPLPDKVMPLTVVKEGVADIVICVEVPIKTFWPPEMERLEELTVRLPRVVVPMPPLLTGTRPVEVKFFCASVKTKEEAVKVAIFTFPPEVTVNKELLEEEETLNGLVVPLP